MFKRIQETFHDALSLPRKYWIIILWSIILGILVGFTLLIWLPGGVLLIPIATIAYLKKRENLKKTRI